MIEFLSDWKTLTGFGVSLFGASAVILYIPGIKTFLLGTRYGRYIIIAATVILIVVVALVRARQLGRRDEQEKQKKQTAENETTRKALDNDLANDSDDDLVRRGNRWLRP